jgi:hypothetical protein
VLRSDHGPFAQRTYPHQFSRILRNKLRRLRHIGSDPPRLSLNNTRSTRLNKSPGSMRASRRVFGECSQGLWINPQRSLSMIGHGPISVKRSHSTHLRFSAESYPENSSTRSVDNLWLRQGRTALLVSVQHSGISPQPDQNGEARGCWGPLFLPLSNLTRCPGSTPARCRGPARMGDKAKPSW